jgi:DNA repair protein RecO
MGELKTNALVLRSIDWSDSSSIVSLYSREDGRIDVVAKGARRSKSPFRGTLESLNLINAIIYTSPTRELQNLSQANIENSFHQIRADLDKMTYALAISELVYIFLRHSENDPVFFDFLIQLLNGISTSENPNVVFWYFLLKFSSYLGFKPDFENCTVCGQALPAGTVGYFSYSDGALTCTHCAGSHAFGNPLIPDARIYLLKLQRASHKLIADFPATSIAGFSITDFLVSYLRFHTGQSFELTSLKYLV